MVQPASKRYLITLYSGSHDLASHRVRFVLSEKGVNADIIEISSNPLPADLLQLNPYGHLPILIDRDLVLHEANIITEYLDERFPCPPLLPVYPVARAKSRQMIIHIERDWYPLVKQLETPGTATGNARQILQASLANLTPLFDNKLYFSSDTFTLVDCCIAPLLWRLLQLGIDSAVTAKATKNYCERLFKRPAFKASLLAT